MKIPHYLMFFFLFRIIPLHAALNSNEIILKGKFCNCKEFPKKIWINSFYGNALLPLDTTAIKKNGTFSFKLILPKHSGYYRLSVSKNNYTDIILCPGENPYFNFDSCALRDWKSVEGSIENELLLKSKLLAKDQKDRSVFMKALVETANTNRLTFFGKTTMAYLPLSEIVPDTFKTNQNKINYSIDHYFDYTDFSNADIVHSTLLPNIYMRYFEQYTEYNEDGFKKSIDLMLQKAQVNEFVYDFTIDFLISLFKKVGPEIILEYIIENYYFKYSCGSNNLSSETTKIINSYATLLTGNSIPDFKFISKSMVSDSVAFSSVYSKNKITAIIFWSSYCHYCEVKSPEWNILYDKYKNKGFELLLVSLDEDDISWEKGILDKKLKGIHTCDKKGWGGNIVKKLNINRTPYIYLISDNGKILLKDPSIDQLKVFVANYFQ